MNLSKSVATPIWCCFWHHNCGMLYSLVLLFVNHKEAHLCTAQPITAQTVLSHILCQVDTSGTVNSLKLPHSLGGERITLAVCCTSHIWPSMQAALIYVASLIYYLLRAIIKIRLLQASRHDRRRRLFVKIQLINLEDWLLCAKTSYLLHMVVWIQMHHLESSPCWL